MPHPVGGAMGVTRVCREKGIHYSSEVRFKALI